ncbi:hypothetical protein FBUS_04994 [Fasciolopsis buskii]|uniref:Uncharacterized protein n=1 Tax=Fasciolopsis buskii TaxID=27845 RepID=A0A8E0VKE0_9TREM|nr:hypothetical protein FBUS_04994 [Fasciolopsis buski]
MPCFQCGKQFTVLSREPQSTATQYSLGSAKNLSRVKIEFLIFSILSRMMRLGIHQGQANAKPVASVNDANSIPGALPDELEIRAKNLLHDVPSGNIPSFEELESRLRNLIDEKPSKSGSHPVFQELSDEEKVSQIINKVWAVQH